MVHSLIFVKFFKSNYTRKLYKPKLILHIKTKIKENKKTNKMNYFFMFTYNRDGCGKRAVCIVPHEEKLLDQNIFMSTLKVK